VLEHLPEPLRPSIARALRQAWSGADAELARKQLERIADSLDPDHPGAARSLREGLSETLTLQRLGLANSALARTLRTTNPIENLMSCVGRYTRNVKRWRGGRMILRWVGAALRQAQPGFRRARGFRELADMLRALDQVQAVDADSIAA
jgi:transposase-like protein